MDCVLEMSESSNCLPTPYTASNHISINPTRTLYRDNHILDKIRAVSRDRRTFKAMLIPSVDAFACDGALAVMSASLRELGAPIEDENSFSSMYTAQKTLLHRFECSVPTT